MSTDMEKMKTVVKLGTQKTLVRTSELLLGELSRVSDGGREFTV